jgi:hypothetical protein
MNPVSGISIKVNMKLPYHPAIDEIFYVEGKHTIKIERWRIEYFSDIIKESLSNPKEYIEGYFSLIVQLLDTPILWKGFSEQQQAELKGDIVDSFCFADYVDLGRDIPPSLFVYHSKLKDGSYKFQQFEVGEKCIWETLMEAFAYIDYRDRTFASAYDKYTISFNERDEIIKQMQQCARRLLEMGMSEEDIEENIFQSRDFLLLVVKGNLDIELHQKKGKLFTMVTKVNLSPLDKAVYLLFLRHPEGINFSYLSDYRAELMDIYRKLMYYRTTASMQRSIEDVTDPTKNSINEKCARIRRAFVDILGNYLAPAYCITGTRGEVKKITLDRNLVRWDE